MTTNYSIGGLANITSAPSIPAELSTRTNGDSTNEQIVNQIQTTKDLKQAEIKGENFSVGEEQLIKAIEKANKALEGVATSFEFSIHEKTKQIMVKVVEKDTGRLIREIPPEKILDMVAIMCEKAGILIDERR